MRPIRAASLIMALPNAAAAALATPVNLDAFLTAKVVSGQGWSYAETQQDGCVLDVAPTGTDCIGGVGPESAALREVTLSLVLPEPAARSSRIRTGRGAHAAASARMMRLPEAGSLETFSPLRQRSNAARGTT